MYVRTRIFEVFIVSGSYFMGFTVERINIQTAKLNKTELRSQIVSSMYSIYICI